MDKCPYCSTLLNPNGDLDKNGKPFCSCEGWEINNLQFRLDIAIKALEIMAEGDPTELGGFTTDFRTYNKFAARTLAELKEVEND